MRNIYLAAWFAALALPLAGWAEEAASAKTHPSAGKSEHSVKAPKAAPKPARSPLHLADPGPLAPGQVVYQVLLAEIALQRGRNDLAVSAYANLSYRTRDPQILARTVEVASYARRFDVAYEAARVWVEVAPDSTKARQTLAGLMVVMNRVDDLAPELGKLLEDDPTHLPDNLAQLNALFARYPDKAAVLRLVQRVTTPYLAMAEAHYALAQASLTAGDRAQALAEVRRARELKPTWDAPVLLEAQVVSGDSVPQAINLLETYLVAHPQAQDVRLTLARAYVLNKQFDQAATQFRRLLQDNPDNPEVIYPVAILALQQGDNAMAEIQLRRLLALDFNRPDLVHFYLGQLAESDGRNDEALAQYAAITAGDQYFPALGRRAQLLAKTGHLGDARTLLQNAAVRSETERDQLVLAEAQLLRENQQPEEAFRVLEARLKTQPDQTDLLYDAALLAEKLGKLPVTEAYLRHLVKLQPDNAHALNALGYTLADHRLQLDEARRLIAKALSLAPDDPFIMDSMGWVMFRQGDMAGALDQLRKAYGVRPDPEIAAHLGEVLWSMGRQDEARQTLQDAQRKDPGNEVLSAAVRKFAAP